MEITVVGLRLPIMAHFKLMAGTTQSCNGWLLVYKHQTPQQPVLNGTLLMALFHAYFMLITQS